MSERSYEAIVIGGGPAGLAASLWLARYHVPALLLDAGDPRNAPTTGVHGYLGLESVPPMQLRAIGRSQARAAGAAMKMAIVESVAGEKDAFLVRTVDGMEYAARRVLFATGLRDIIPEIPGLLDCYGTSIWHCPDCDGPEAEGLRVGVIGWGRQIAAFCMEMLTWTRQITVLTHGHDPQLPEDARGALAHWGIPVEQRTIASIHGRSGRVKAVNFRSGGGMPFDAMFFHIAFGPGCSIPASLGCQADEGGILEVDPSMETTVPGVYAAGDITAGSKLAICAAAEGTRAAIGIYRSLMPDDRRF